MRMMARLRGFAQSDAGNASVEWVNLTVLVCAFAAFCGVVLQGGVITAAETLSLNLDQMLADSSDAGPGYSGAGQVDNAGAGLGYGATAPEDRAVEGPEAQQTRAAAVAESKAVAWTGAADPKAEGPDHHP